MTGQQFATAAFGAGLTLLGAVILLVLQTLQSNVEDRRSYEREWHKELVDLVSDIEIVMIYLSGMMRDGEAFTEDRRAAVFDGFFADRGLLWRIYRIERGHPNRDVRSMASAVAYAMVHINGFALNGINLKLAGNTEKLAERGPYVEKLLSELRNTLNRLSAAVHAQPRSIPRAASILPRRRKPSGQ